MRAAVFLMLLAGCRTTRPTVPPEETFFIPLAELPKPATIKPQTPAISAPQTRPAGKADSLLNSQRDQDRRIVALAEQLERLEATRRGARPDSTKPVPRTTQPLAAPKPVSTPPDDKAIGAAERLYASGEYRKTIQWCQDALERGALGGIEDQCYFLMGASRYRLKQFDLALVSLKKVLDVKASSKRADASFLMGLTYRELGMRERSATMFGAALKESPDEGLARSIRRELDRLAKNR